MKWSWFSLLKLLLLLGITDGYLNGQIVRCDFNSSDPDDIQYISSYFYNKLEFIRFDSAVGRFVGYTEFGAKTAERWNNDPNILQRMRYEKYRYCVHNTKIWYNNILSKSVVPTGFLHLEFNGTSERVLVCSVYSFYPKDISVTWTNHKQQIHSGVYTTEPMPDSLWYYQVHSHLEYTPRPEDKISCVIEHISLKEPLILDYDGALSGEDMYKLLIGASGLVLGLALALLGFIYHRSKGLMSATKH